MSLNGRYNMPDEKGPPAAGPDRVGYRNPPEYSRFKKGQSGNPRGRPKGTLNLATVLSKTLREKVVINEHGQRKVVNKLEAAVKQLVNKSAAGDLAALRQLSALVQSAEEQAAQAPVTNAPLSEDDQKVVQGVLERFDIGGGNENETDNK
jgi:Family of unknown function (DUF5681)